MADTHLIDDLLSRWEDLRRKHHSITVEELCAACPELLVETRRRIEALETMDSWLGPADLESTALPPSSSQSTSPDPGRSADATAPSAMAPDPVGQPKILGEYEILERLGKGGMGEVYRARHRRLGKLVALKLLPSGAVPAPEVVERFQKEMRAVGGLDHDNVVEAHDAGEENGTFYLVMKLIDGTDLSRLVRERGPLPVTQVVALGAQIARGLEHLHEKGLVHRDVKPSNLMLTTQGTVKILDFGLARLSAPSGAGADRTLSGHMMGTPDYVAPEQVANAATVDIRADLYGLGGTLFYLLTGKAPFDDRSSLIAKLDAHRYEAPPDVRSLRPDAPPSLADLTARLLAKKPEDRPQTPAEVRSLLAAGEPGGVSPRSILSVAAPADSTVSENIPLATPSAKRRRRLALIAAAASILLLGGLATLLLLNGPREEERPSPSPLVRKPDGKVRVVSLKVNHFPLTKDGSPRALVLGVNSFAPRLKDMVTIEAELSRPAYAYLIAFRPDGTDELCFPERDDEPPPLSDVPRYPLANDRGAHYGLDEGVGLGAFAVVASDRPLPAYRVWREQMKNSPWKSMPAPGNVVWTDDGIFSEAKTPTGTDRGDRAKERTMPGKSAIVALTDWLKRGAGVEAVRTIGFSVGE